MEYPTITKALKTGFPNNVTDPEVYGTDALGNEVFEGDEILVFEDEFFLVETLLYETRKALEVIGAVYDIAE